MILDFTTPNVNTNYVVKWILNSPVASVPVVTSSNMFAGSTYDAISPPMTPTGSNLCFVTGIIETNGYLRIEEVP